MHQIASLPYFRWKKNSLKKYIHCLKRQTLLCLSLFTPYKRSTASDVIKQKVSKTNGMQACWMSEHDFSRLATLLEAALRVVSSTVKTLVLRPTCGETPIKSTHACFLSTHPYTRTFDDLSVDLPSHGLFLHKYLGMPKHIK